ncbi:MAG: hypothetical protein ACFE85_04695 [Candidatus Hodarchaeota archaeon]
METEYNKDNSGHALKSSESESNKINVRAIISCPTCGYIKKFKNQFARRELELMVVAVKVFDWMVCSTCGELLKLDLEFNI